MILHTINKSSAWNLCKELVQPGDSVVLLENGVNLIFSRELDTGVNWYAVDVDISARGAADRLPDTVSSIDYVKFVELSASADQICNWF